MHAQGDFVPSCEWLNVCQMQNDKSNHFHWVNRKVYRSEEQVFFWKTRIHCYQDDFVVCGRFVFKIG